MISQETSQETIFMLDKTGVRRSQFFSLTKSCKNLMRQEQSIKSTSRIKEKKLKEQRIEVLQQ